MITTIAQAVERDPTFLEQITPLITLAVGVLALVGVVLAQWMGRRLWLREQRLRAYADLIEAGDLVWRVADDLWLLPRAERIAEVDRLTELIDTLHERIHTLQRIAHGIRILGPDKVAEAAYRFSRAHVALFKLVTDDARVEAGIAEHGEAMSESEEGREQNDAGYAFVAAAAKVVR